jgi:heptaprenylglyceryl phosphate synthase
MKTSDWIAILSLIISMLAMFFSIYFPYLRGPEISIEGFSTFDIGMMTIDNNKDTINKTFFVYNSGAKSAFISMIDITDYDKEKKLGLIFPLENLTLDNRGNFILEPSSSEPINFVLKSVKEPVKIKITVIYGPGDNTLEKCIQIVKFNQTSWNTFQFVPPDIKNWDKC